MTDPVIKDAIRIRNQLVGVEKELRYRADSPRASANEASLLKMDAMSVAQAGAMLEKLGTEVFRLREIIGHFRHGMATTSDIYRIAATWNDGKPVPSTATEREGT